MDKKSANTFTICQEAQQKRLDILLCKRFAKSRAYFQKLIEEGHILINRKKVKKSARAEMGDEITVFIPEKPEIKLKAENLTLDILFEDEHIIVLNKPAGMVVHPAAGNWEHTLSNALLHHCRTTSLPGTEELRPGIVHRLDKDTSGLLIAAKTEEALQKLALLFSQRKIYKEYLAVTVGKRFSQKASFAIGRDPKNRKKMAVRETGKPAETDFSLLAFKDGISLVSAVLKTGRTHQIRVHLRHLNTPVLGDTVYGFSGANRLYQAKRPLLHAYKLQFAHPITQTEIKFTAEPPEDIKNFICQIAGSCKILA